MYSQPVELEDSQHDQDQGSSEATPGMETHAEQSQRSRTRREPIHKDLNVREPTAAEIQEFQSLQDIANWARLQGDVNWPASKPGALLRLLVNDEDMENYEIDEFASISPKQLEKVLGAWKFSAAESPPGSI